MKRKIEFRAKTLNGNLWRYGYLTECDDFVLIDQRNEAFEDSILDALKGDDCYFRIAVSKCRKDTVGQYTGLKDKNGKEIYEGDIVRSDSRPFSTGRVKDNLYAVVEWSEYNAMFTLVFFFNPNGTKRGNWDGERHIIGSFDKLEVIGNIHDNPELVNKD